MVVVRAVLMVMTVVMVMAVIMVMVVMMFMIVVVVMAVALDVLRLAFDARLAAAAAAYVTHQSTSNSLIRNSSPPES